MIRLRRKLGLLLTLSAAAAAPAAAQASDFEAGVDLMRRDRKEEALAAFQRALAAGLEGQEAYDLWNSVEDSRMWLDMMVEGGEYELVAKRLADLARMGRVERKNDRDAIRGLIGSLRGSEDRLEQSRLVQKLSADHGEYAVPFLASALADPNDDDWRVTAMMALTRMGTDVVPPLLVALNSDDPFLRRNTAMVLGNIGDQRAAGALEALAQSDTDGGVQAAAREAAQACASNGDAVGQLLKNGDDYHHQRANVLRPHEWSDVTWSIGPNGLESIPTPRPLYADAMSVASYYRALAVASDSSDALAGIARGYVDMGSKINGLAESGDEGAEDWRLRIEAGLLAVSLAGPEALDRALTWSVETSDTTAGVALARALGAMANRPSPGLAAALASKDGAISGEAAVALGHVFASTGEAAGRKVVAQLGESAAREIVRIAAVIDGRAGRGSAVSAALTANGVLVNQRERGAAGLVMLHRVPGLDVIVLGDTLSDMTLDQVLRDIASHPATEDTPVYLLSDKQETIDLYSDRTAGSLSGAGDIAMLDAAFEASLTGDRARAADLASRAADVLGRLADAGQTDLSPALASLSGAIGRDDSVSVPVMRALRAGGTPAEIAALAATVADDSRSDEARIAAADAITGILTRSGSSSAGVDVLSAVLKSDASLAVRQAAARAVGRMGLSAADRARLLREIRPSVQ